jgi:uncharacterized protein YydD (DUF2326 family)
MDEEKELKLETSIKAFDVDENYLSVRAAADRDSKESADIANQIFLLRNAVLNIEKSLKITPDLSKESVEKVYAEAKFIFNADVKKELDEVLNFHADLIEKRRIRLIKEKTKLNNKVATLVLKLTTNSNKT